ncbi:MAG: sugar transferase, partial [Thermoguttaceae bacterium]|nr:sugar transferase [Thermoguttaceae bacterium]
KIIFAIKPGITDWASLSNFEQYRDFARAADPDRFFEAVIRPLKLDLQLYYCTHRSLIGDLYIIICTAMRIVKVKLPLPREVREIIAKHHAIIADKGVAEEETILSQPNGTGQ